MVKPIPPLIGAIRDGKLPPEVDWSFLSAAWTELENLGVYHCLGRPEKAGDVVAIRWEQEPWGVSATRTRYPVYREELDAKLELNDESLAKLVDVASAKDFEFTSDMMPGHAFDAFGHGARLLAGDVPIPLSYAEVSHDNEGNLMSTMCLDGRWVIHLIYPDDFTVSGNTLKDAIANLRRNVLPVVDKELIGNLRSFLSDFLRCHRRRLQNRG